MKGFEILANLMGCTWSRDGLLEVLEAEGFEIRVADLDVISATYPETEDARSKWNIRIWTTDSGTVITNVNYFGVEPIPEDEDD